MKNSGQVLILLLLIMVVALAIGLSTIGRSIIEVSTSKKSEDSSRAFSAAEAGIESALRKNVDNIGGVPTPVPPVNLSNNATANVTIARLLPLSNTALAYSSIRKEGFAQFWLANPNDDPPSAYYNQNSFDVYFGDPNPPNPNHPGVNYYVSYPDDKPAIEVDVTYWDGSKYLSKKQYFDSAGSPRSGFSGCGVPNPVAITTNNSVSTSFYCKANVTGYSGTPIMVRIRFLYTSIPHPVAINPLGGGSLPPQANVYNSVGSAGDVRRTLEVTNYKEVMPLLFDYVLFSANNLQK